MPNRVLRLASALLALLFASGCAGAPNPGGGAARPDKELQRMLDELPMAGEVPVYGNVTAYDHILALVFEGYTDDKAMTALADYVAERGIPTVFFLPGEAAMESREAARRIAAAGIPIGNYGLSGEPGMERNSAEKNIRQLYLTQRAIEDAASVTPEYVRYNRSEPSGELLAIPGLLGLRAVVQPGVYLNHRSFASAEQAKEFVRSVPRGSLITVKLGQELDETELYVSPVLRTRSADQQRDGGPERETGPVRKNNIDPLTLVEWLAAACESEGRDIVSLEELQRAGEEDVPAAEVPEELLRKLDPSLYQGLTTPEPFGAPEHEPAGDSFFDGAVFVGDSVTAMGLRRYAELRRREEPGFLGTAEFLAEGGLSARNALWQVSGESRHPAYRGERMPLEDAIALMGADKVYLMLGMNDVLLSDTEAFLGNYQTLIRLIRRESPGAEIYIQSITPGTNPPQLEPNNRQILEYNLALVEFSAKYGYHYIDVAHVLRGEDGALPRELCADEGGSGFHIRSDACGVWADYLYTHTK